MGEEARRTHGAHRDYYLWLAEEASNALLSQEHTNWLERLQAEDDNLRAALEWSRGQPDQTEALARLVAALKDYWAYTGRFSEGRRWAEEALADRERVSRHHRIRLLFTAGRLALDLGDYQEAEALLDESLVLAREESDPCAEAEALSNQGYLVQACDRQAKTRPLDPGKSATSQLDGRPTEGAARGPLARRWFLPGPV